MATFKIRVGIGLDKLLEQTYYIECESKEDATIRAINIFYDDLKIKHTTTATEKITVLK